MAVDDDVVEWGRAPGSSRARLLRGAALGVVGLVVVVVGVRASRGTSAPEPKPAPTATVTARHLVVRGIQFYGTDEAVAVVVHCASALVGDCDGSPRLVRTVDGGKSWHTVPSPLDGTTANSAQLLPAGPVLDLQVDDKAYVSADRGLHWRTSVESTYGPEVQTLAAGTLPSNCPDQPLIPACRPGLAAYDPVRNTLSRLANQPDLDGAESYWWPGSSKGRIWVYVDGDHDRLVHTEDAGRTWRPQALPAGIDTSFVSLLTDESVERVVLTVHSTDGRLRQLWRLDAGRWTRMPVPAAALADLPAGSIKQTRLLPDGQVWLTTDDVALRTEDEGARVVAPRAEVDGEPVEVTEIVAESDGILYAAPPDHSITKDGRIVLLVSLDSGRTWSARTGTA